MHPHPTATLVSVVIPCRNGAATLGQQLEALAGQDYPGPIEIIVADNGSGDDTAALAASHPGVRLVDASGIQGPNHARNLGADQSHGQVILTCDADDVVAPGWVSAMVRALEEHDLAGGPLEYARLNPGVVPPPAEFHSRFGFLPTAAGANFGIRADVLRSLGGWDGSFGYGPDDTELCWRAQLAGYRFGWADDALVHYRLRATHGARVKQAFEGGSRIPLLLRRFRSKGMPVAPMARKALRWIGYLTAAAPAALLVPRIRAEWLRRAALGAGFVRGLIRTPPPHATD
jgi:glycosyltransferase involved in cell wall biosynthesis